MPYSPTSIVSGRRGERQVVQRAKMLKVYRIGQRDPARHLADAAQPCVEGQLSLVGIRYIRQAEQWRLAMCDVKPLATRTAASLILILLHRRAWRRDAASQGGFKLKPLRFKFATDIL
jgi:hypothetical protein